MTMKHNGAVPARSQEDSDSQMKPVRDTEDIALADESSDLDCIHRFVAAAERSAQLVDDGMNVTEASEERHARSESQAMR